MRLRDLFFLHEILPADEWQDIGRSVIDAELALLDIEEAREMLEGGPDPYADLILCCARAELAAAEAAIELKKIQYGVGP